MRRAILIILATVLLAASSAYTNRLRLEPEGFTLPALGGTTGVNGANASGFQALKFTASNRLASQAFTLDGPATAVTIRARGVAASSKFASMRVHTSGTSATEAVLTQHVNTTGYTQYTASIDLPAGTHTVYLHCMDGAASAEPNDADCTSTRNIIVDWVQFTYTTPFTVNNSPTDAAGNTDASAATRSFSVQAPTQPYPGIRFYKMVGIAEYDSVLMTATRVQNDYNTYMRPAYHGSDDSVDFVVQTKLNWEDVLDNESTVPTHTQMRNPNWSGYKWDTAGSDAAEIDAMLNASCVQNGKCKVSINLGLGATGGTNAPQFMVDRGLAWVGDGRTASNTRVKYYKPEAVQYASEFTLAMLDRFSDPNVGSVMISEYFPGASRPADYDDNAYISGYETYLENVVAGAPRDGAGNRVTIYQANPITATGLLEASDFTRLMVGISDSNAQMFEEPAGQESLRAALRAGGVNQVPMSAPLDSVPFNNNDATIYPAGTPNPWNYSGSVRMDVPQIAWYYGRCGPDPMDQQFISTPGRATDGFPNEPNTGFIGAMDQFGPGGGDHSSNCSPSTDDWGGVPFAQ